MGKRAMDGSANVLAGGDRLDDAGEHIVQIAHPINHGQLALLLIEIDHRRGLVVIDLEAGADRFRACLLYTFSEPTRRS